MQLGFAIGGAALGYGMFGAATFMGMSAASWGWSAGSLLGGILGNKNVDLPPQFGPRLSDLKVQTSTYGNAIPRAFGTVRIAGNIIWAPPITEVATTTTVESGGKGGGGGSSQEQTTYSYYADFAVAICEGPIIGIRKVWANGDLINDLGDDSPILSKLGSLATILSQAIAAHNAANDTISMTVYTGSETQSPDPTIAAMHGSQTPAFRGTAYVVFQGLPLAKFGNRIPNLEFEVVVNGEHTIMVPQLFYTLPGGITRFGVLSEDVHLRRNSPGATHYWAVVNIGSPANPRQIALFNNYDQGLVLTRNESGNIRLLSETGLNGRMWYQVEATSINAISLTGQVWEFDNVGGDYVEQLYEFPDFDLEETDTQENAPRIFLQRVNPGPGSVQIYYGNASSMSTMLTVSTGHGSSNFLRAADRIADRVYIRGTTFGGGVNSHVGYADVATGAFTTIRAYNSTADPSGMVGRDGYVYVRSANTGFYNVIEKLDQDGTVIDSITLPGISTSNVEPMIMVQDATGLLYVQIDREIFRISPGTMDLDAQATLAFPDDYIMGDDAFEGRGILVARSDIGYRDKLYMLSDSVSSEAPLLSEVVEDLCLLTGLTAGDLDTTDLSGDTVSGYVISQRSTVRSMLEPLMGTYFFDAVESDNKIKFVKRGGGVAVTIPEDDLAAHTGAPGEMPDSVRVMRKQEMDLPVEVNVSYLNRAIDYQVSQQPSRRLITQSKQSVTLQVPIVFTDTQAKRIADMHIFSAWVERENHEFETGREYAKYEPCDVVGVVKGGVTHNVRITQKDEGGDGVIKWKAVADYASVYSQVSTGVAVQSEAQTVSMVGMTDLALLDVPLLRDVDDDAGFYYAAGGSSAGWRGVNLYQSLDGGVTYTAISSMLPESTMGYATTALGDYDEDLVEIIDEGNSVTVVIMHGGTLASVTREEMLDGANAALLGGQPFHFRDATLVDTDTYELTGLLRGRRGAETYMTGHVAGERFVLLNENLRSVALPVSLKDQALYYKPVSFGNSVAQTNALAFVNTARKKMPLSPVDIGGGKNGAGDWLIQWRRRTRYEALWLETADVPLGENAERYEVDILQASEVVRTLESSTPSVTYTLAQQVADFGAERSGLGIAVYQVSTEVGRGYAATKTFTNSAPAYYWKIHDITVPNGTWFELYLMRLISDTGVELIATPAGSGQNMTFTVPGMAGSGSGTISHFVFSARHFYELFLSTSKDTADSVLCQHSGAPAGGVVMTWNFSSIGKVTVAGVKQAPSDTGAGRHMSAFTLSRSDDGVNWIVVGSKSGLAEPAVFTLSDEYDF